MGSRALVSATSPHVYGDTLKLVYNPEANNKGRIMGLRVISVKMEEELIELLDSYARKLRVSRSEIIRSAVEELLSRNLTEDKEKDEDIEFKVLKIYT